MKVFTSIAAIAVLISCGCGGAPAEPTAYDLLRETKVKVNGEYVDASHLSDEERKMVQQLIKRTEGEFAEEVRDMERELDRFDSGKLWMRDE